MTNLTISTTVAQEVTSPALEARNGQITATSLQVAMHFKKRHGDVLRAIKNLDVPDDYRQRNFASAKYLDEQRKPRDSYHITRDGFALLAMGFTGREALRWKVAFLQAFRQHEADLADLQARYVAALDVLRPHLRTVVQDFEGGLPRSDTAMWLGKTPAAVTYHRSQARRLGLLPALAVRRVA